MCLNLLDSLEKLTWRLYACYLSMGKIVDVKIVIREYKITIQGWRIMAWTTAKDGGIWDYLFIYLLPFVLLYDKI